MSEDKLAVECYTWFHNYRPKLRGLVFHIPNGGSRNKIEAAKLKMMGVTPGVPDYACNMNGGRIAYIELKRPDGKGALSKRQKELHALYRMQNIPIFTVNSLEEFQTIIDKLYNYES